MQTDLKTYHVFNKSQLSLNINSKPYSGEQIPSKDIIFPHLVKNLDSWKGFENVTMAQEHLRKLR